MVTGKPEMPYDLTSDFPTLSKAPITEALIDIQVELPPAVDLAQLKTFYHGLEERFPKSEERVMVSGTIGVNQKAEPEFTSDAKPDGLLMRSEAEGLIVQARLDGFTLNKLEPYVSWASLKRLASELWQRYLQIARPTRVKRLAVRYTNKLELPTGIDFKEVLLTAPDIAEGIPQGLPEYFVRLVIPHPVGAIAIVTQASLPATLGSKTVQMLFDIDTFRFVKLDPTDHASMWAILDELRAYKNVIFFNSINPKQMEKYR